MHACAHTHKHYKHACTQSHIIHACKNTPPTATPTNHVAQESGTNKQRHGCRSVVEWCVARRFWQNHNINATTQTCKKIEKQHAINYKEAQKKNTMCYQLHTQKHAIEEQCNINYAQKSNVPSTTLHKNIHRNPMCPQLLYTKHTQESNVTSTTLHKNIHRNPIWPQLLYTKIYTEIQCQHAKQECNVLATTSRYPTGSGIYSDYKALSPTQRYKTRTQHVINRISSWQRGINHWHNVLPNAQRHTTGIQ